MAAKSVVPAGAGYSATPLARKLGLQPGAAVCALHPPGDYRTLVAPWPEGARMQADADAGTDLAHLFVSRRALLARELARLRKRMRDDAVLWVSWPKQAARVETDVSEDVVRELALPLGWVDVKVCAVDAVWSGLKLVVRRELRA